LARLVLLPTVLLLFALPVTGDDWPQWRGPHRDGISAEHGLLATWTSKGPPLAWQAEGLGSGYASVAVAGGKIFTLGDRKGGTQLIALDVDGGKELWSAKVGGGSPNCTPTVDGDLVFALGRDGDLVCAETATGKIVWRKNFPRDYKGHMMSGWGYSESPLVDGDRLIVSPGAKKGMLVALKKRTGETIWSSPEPDDVGPRGKDGAGYSSVVISKACGVKQYIQLTGRGIIAVAAEDGTPLWTYNKVANDTANIPTPLVKNDYVFCSTGYDTGAALLKVVKDGDSLKAQEVYFLPPNKLQNHHGGMILLGDHVYCGHGHNNGQPLCIELLTGKPAWGPVRGAGSGSAAIAYADGHLYFRYENGTMALIEATPKAYQLSGSFKLASVKAESWPHPVISDGKLYLRDQDVLMCYNLKK
jgi:outer membrane protein assembly factor BamB